MVVVKDLQEPAQKAIRQMQLFQMPKVSASFDEPNLIASAGLVPVMRLARQAGLPGLVARMVSVPGGAGVDAAAKVASVVAEMITGADSIDDLGLLREGAVGKVLPGVKAPSTLGTFLRAFTFGHVRQLDAVADRLLTELAGQVGLLPGPAAGHRDAVCWLDVDDTMRQTHGYRKQGVGYGYNKVKGLNALLATVSTDTTGPIIVGHRLRKGGVNSARGAGKFLADAVAAARRTGITGVICCRLDSAYYHHRVVAAIGKAGARFSITARMDRAVQNAVAGIDQDAWMSIKYPRAIYDQDEQRWISDAQVAEIPYTAFTSKPAADQVSARLIVRRVKRLNPVSAPQGQGELFAAYRHHAVFTNSAEPMLTAEAHHRDHAIIEQVIADLKDSALAHFPSGKFNANAAWLACAVIAYNLARAAGVAAGRILARARTATIRSKVINIPARVSYSAGNYTLHLPANSRRQAPFITMFDTVHAPPQAA
jgi:hypothetical protein